MKIPIHHNRAPEKLCNSIIEDIADIKLATHNLNICQQVGKYANEEERKYLS